jgi:hypothetical protein
MKNRLLALGALFAIGFALSLTFAPVREAISEPLNYMSGQGGLWVVGGELDIGSAATVKSGSTDISAALATPVAGVASGYKLARGETALDGSNPTPVTTGLTTIVACTLTIKATAALGDNTSVVSYGTSSGTMNMYGFKNTGGTDPTLVDSTGTDTIGWICVGT